MPKTYSDAEKIKWMTKLDRGESIKQVANKANCDTRTVLRAVDEIRSRRAAQEALTQLYKDKLLEHMNKLNAALDMIIDDLHLPDPYITEIAWLYINTKSADHPDTDKKIPNMEDDPLSDNALLAEHLRNNKAWRAFADWRRLLKKHRDACGELQEKALSVIIEKTGISIQSKKGKATPFLHVENTGDLLCRKTVNQLNIKENILELEKELNIDLQQGVVLHNSTFLVEGIFDVDELTKCKENIIRSYEILKESSEAQQLWNTYKQLKEVLPRVKTGLRTIRLMGIISGQCRVCEQFGL